jgi:KDO2-lipid IV(A) lauroyltransferase
MNARAARSRAIPARPGEAGAGGERGRAVPGAWIVQVLGAALGWLVGSVIRVRRSHVIAAMQRAGVPDPSRTAAAMYRALGRGLFELLGLPLGLETPVALPTAILDRLCSAGRGAVIATAHTGNWDVVACAIAEQFPLSVVTKRLSVGFLDRIWQGTRRARGVRLITVGGAARSALQAIGRGELVAMLVDQAPERDRAVVRVPFLGAVAVVDLSPALCALRGRAPLVAAFPMRLPDGSLAVHVAGVLDPPRIPSRRWAEESMTQVTAWLEAFVREHPEQWLWMHRRWKGAATAGALPLRRDEPVAGFPEMSVEGERRGEPAFLHELQAHAIDQAELAPVLAAQAQHAALVQRPVHPAHLEDGHEVLVEVAHGREPDAVLQQS